MYQGKQIFGFKMEHLLIFTLLILLLTSCKNERPKTVVTTPTRAPTVESISAIDPTIAAILAQVSPSPEGKATIESNTTPTQTPEFVCTQPTNWVAYTVQNGDTLSMLAANLGISINEIKSSNCLLYDILIVENIIYLPSYPSIRQNPIIVQNPPFKQPQLESNEINDENQEDKKSSFSLDNSSQKLPEGMLQEFSSFIGGGGGGGDGPFWLEELTYQPGKTIPTIVYNDPIHIEEIILFYFEPKEVVHLTAYTRKKIKEPYADSSWEFAGAQAYEVNSEGFVIIDNDPRLVTDTMFLAIGEQSSFADTNRTHHNNNEKLLSIDETSIELEIINNSPEKICHLFISPPNNDNELHHLFEKSPFIVFHFEAGDRTITINPGIYALEALDCEDEIIAKENNFEIDKETVWEIP